MGKVITENEEKSECSSMTKLINVVRSYENGSDHSRGVYDPLRMGGLGDKRLGPSAQEGEASPSSVTAMSFDGLPSYNLDGTAIVLPQALLEPPEPKISSRRRKHRQNEGKSARTLKLEAEAKVQAAAIKMQATVRGHNARKDSSTREAAAVRMQATFRGRNARNAPCKATVRHTTLPAIDHGSSTAEIWGHNSIGHNLQARHSLGLGYGTTVPRKSRPPIVIQVLMPDSRSRSSRPGPSPRSSRSSQSSSRSSQSSRTRRSSRSDLMPWHHQTWHQTSSNLTPSPAAKPASNSVEELLIEWNWWRTLPDDDPPVAWGGSGHSRAKFYI